MSVQYDVTNRDGSPVVYGTADDHIDNEDEVRMVIIERKELTHLQWRDYLKWSTIKSEIRSLFQRWYQYIIYTMRDTSKRKVSFCIGLASCFIVVWMILLAMTVLDQVPLLFMRLAETQAGEYDLRLSANAFVDGQSLNYHTITKALIETNTTLQNTSPRFIFNDVSIYKMSSCDVSNATVGDPYSWMYRGNSSLTCGRRRPGSSPTHDFHPLDYNQGKYCVPLLCGRGIVGSGAQLVAMDTERERKMGFGRRWNLPPAPKGKAYITGGTSFTLNLDVGDKIVVSLRDTLNVMMGPYREMNGVIDPETNQDTKKRLSFNNGLVYIQLEVQDIIVDYAGKIESAQTDAVIVEYENLFSHVSEFLPMQVFNETHKGDLARSDPYRYSQFVYVNNDPSKRLQVYNNNDYNRIQAQITSFATRIMYNIGFNQVTSEFPILSYMRETRFFAMFLGLIISIIVTILTILSIILIYSLLMISVENKQFEMGVLRMIGMTRAGMIQLILLQAFCYAVPAWIVGVLLGQVTYVGVSYALSRTLQLEELSRWVTPSAVLIATAVGMIVPVASSILPIMTALGQNLNDSLDTNRSRTKAVKYSIERASENDMSPVPIVLGMALAFFGFCVYYFFPLSLLTLNITFLLYMFFWVDFSHVVWFNSLEFEFTKCD